MSVAAHVTIRTWLSRTSSTTRERLARVPRAFWAILATGLAIRLAMLPLMHPWDGQTFLNLFAQLQTGADPYASLSELTLQARSRWHFGRTMWYEYYAYPPMLALLYAPIAKFLGLWLALEPRFFIPVGTSTYAALVSFPLPFLFAFKAPIWLADVFIYATLWRLTGSVRLAALYFLNPLVLLVSGAHMFDAIPVALTLAAYLAFRRDRFALAGVILAFGFLMKWYPVLLLPVFAMHLVWRRDRQVFRLLAAFALVSALVIAPFASGVADAWQFNAMRKGGGLSLHAVPLAWISMSEGNTFVTGEVWSPLLGVLVLYAGLGVFYLWLNGRRPDLVTSLALASIVILLTSKIVNEQYGLWPLPFLLLAMTRARASMFVFHALWAIPFVFAVLRHPAVAYHPAIYAAWGSALELGLGIHPVNIVLALAFTAALIFALWAYRPREASTWNA